MRVAQRILTCSLSGTRDALRLVVAAALGFTGACVGSSGADPDSAATSVSRVGEATLVKTTAVRSRSELRENSAAVMSVRQPGILFTINDSGHDPVPFALDTAGNDRGAWLVRGARNEDWEAAALGPCGVESRRTPGPSEDLALPAPAETGDCLYIGDVGDNAASRPTRVLYRLPEPRAGASGSTDTLPAERLTFRYSDAPHDVEALWVGADGTTWLITKRPLRRTDGTARPALIYALPREAWDAVDVVATAQLSDSVPIVPGSAPGRLITDAARSSDGTRIAIRTYTEVFIFDSDPATGAVASDAATSVCRIAGLRQRQGEGITWFGTSGRLLLTSEGVRAPMHIITC